jgi:transcriptional regulator with XRE-family HTH domain
MSKLPSRPSVLRTARKILGLSQSDLATAVGCSKVTIEKFENGTFRISDDLAYRIMMETTLDLQQLRSNDAPNSPRDIDGNPLSHEGYLHRKELWQRVSRSQVDKERRRDHLRLTLLFDAAARKRKYPLVAMAMRQRIEEFISEFNLQEEVENLRQEYGLPTEGYRFYVVAQMPEILEQVERKRGALYEYLEPTPPDFFGERKAPLAERKIEMYEKPKKVSQAQKRSKKAAQAGVAKTPMPPVA